MVQAGRMMPDKTRNCLARQSLSGRRQAIVCLITWFLVLGMAGHAARPEANLVAVDFENVDLRVFIKFVSEVTGRVFLLDDRVRGQVSVRFADKIPVNQLSDVLESVLEVKGFGIIPAGPITKIVPLGSAKQRGVEVTGSGPSSLDHGRRMDRPGG
jgi:general secretion pathway protein D